MSLPSIVRKMLGQLKQPEEAKWKQKLFILAHGTFTTMIICQITLGASFAITMLSSPTTDDAFYAAAFYAMLLIAMPYQRFWHRNRKNVAKIFENLAAFAENLERNADKEEVLFLRRKVMKLERYHWFIYFAFSLQAGLMCLLPIKDIRLPWALRGLPFYHPVKLALQAFQIFIIGQIALSALQLYIMQISMVFCANAGFEVIAKRFRKVDTTRQEDVRNIVVLHAELSPAVEDFVFLFESSNGVLLFEMMTVALLGTLAAIMGVKSPEILPMAPICFSFVGLACGLSDTLQTSSGKVTEGVHRSRWIQANTFVRKTLLIVIMKSQRPAGLTATLFGRLSYPLMMKILRDWYRIVQGLLKMNIG